MGINLDDIKKLKEQTGVGVTDAKKALEEAGGDYSKAFEEMRKKGLAKAAKKADREAKEGMIDSYLHGDRIGVIVEVNCETDFVARTDDFKDFVHEVALHIAASNPTYVESSEVPAEILDKEKELFKEELKNEGKPEEMLDKIVEGKIDKFYAEVCLLDQPFIKDPDQTVGDLLQSAIAKLGENIVIARFTRYELGVK